MKQLILIGVLTGLLTATIPLQAQVALRESDAGKGSRLELGRTSSPAKTGKVTLSSQRFSLAPNPALTGLDRPITLNKNAAINEHYRSLLLPRSGSKAAARTASVETAAPLVADTRPSPAQEIKEDSRLYSGEKLWVSNAYPNPADHVAELDYQFSGQAGEAKLTLLNVLGASVATHELERNERKLRIVTSDLATGYYLYQLSVDGKKVATKRLLVRHQ
ncbi:T9SS type A sorting domain-containing protein [Spirosoma areae]